MPSVCAVSEGCYASTNMVCFRCGESCCPDHSEVQSYFDRRKHRICADCQEEISKEEDDGADRPVDTGHLSGALAGGPTVADLARLTLLGQRLETVAVTVLRRIAGIGQTLQAHAAKLRRIQEAEP